MVTAPQLVLLIGIQATGKSTFCRERLFDTHVRVNLDMLKTRPREAALVNACLQSKTSFVVDNTNVTRADRARYIPAAREAGFVVCGFFFESRIADATPRNAARQRRVPEAAIRNASARLEVPQTTEGFDTLQFVRIAEAGFTVENWKP